MATINATYTDQQKAQALSNARKALAARRKAAQKIRGNSFTAWGNDRCISRLIDTVNAMERDAATTRQYRYWLAH